MRIDRLAIVEMAKQVGFTTGQANDVIENDRAQDPSWDSQVSVEHEYAIAERLEAFAKLVADAERCDKMALYTGVDCADAIRERGDL